jgi:inner membrane protein
MATIFTHPVIALALSPLFKTVRQSKAVLFTGAVLTIVPDFDVVGLRLGIPYDHLFGHRGITHSLFFAVIFSGLTSWFLAKRSTIQPLHVWFYLFLCMTSHGVLDALTNGGHGIAFFAPFINERYFFPITPIDVSTLSISRFFQGQGVAVIKSELLWVWSPCFVIFIISLFYRHCRVKK